MKKIFLQLVFIFFLSFFLSCEREEFDISNEIHQNQSDYQVKKISFNDVKLNKNAFEKLKESRSKLNRSVLQRGVYNEDFGVFIDTTNILITEKEGRHSITFQIINDEDLSKVKNLVLNAKDDGSYSAFITEYILSQSDLLKLANNEPIGEKTPTSVTDITTNQNTNIINSSNANCVSTFSYDQFVCWSNGELIPTQGNLGDGCQSAGFSATFFVIEIDWGCVSGGGSTGYNPGGSDSGGYNPGGYWTGGGSGSSGGSQTNPNNPILTTPNINYPTVPRDFLSSLTDDQLNWWNAIENSTPRNEIIDYLNNNKIEGTNLVNPEAMAFALELIDLANNEEDKEIIPNLINLSIVTKENGYFENSFDSNYYNLINPYTEVDTEMYNPLWGVYFTVECAVARYKLSQEPGWNDLHPWVQDAKVYWEASKEMIHLGLDLIGLVPVVGEVADLTNGVIYTIEGDGVNASLSFASTIPVAGWFSTGVKFAKRADGLKYLVVGTNNLISFGAYNSKKFRQACGIAIGDATQQAHHLIPRGSQIIEHEVVQRAAKATNNGGFHIDEALNGVAVATWRNQPNHPNYNNLIRQKLVNFLNANPNATPTQCYNQLMIILNQAKQAVINNPNTHLNDLIF
jgi:hypothetical protein